MELSSQDRMLRYLEQIKNPYFFMCGEIAVKISFSPEGDELSEALIKYFTALKQ